MLPEPNTNEPPGRAGRMGLQDEGTHGIRGIAERAFSRFRALDSPRRSPSRPQTTLVTALHREPGARLRVLIVDDQRMIRDMLARELARESDIEIAGTAGDPEELLRTAASLRPDVVLMDVQLAGRTSCGAADRLRAILPDVVIVFLADRWPDSVIERAMRVEASGYLSKSESFEFLVEAIRQGAAGHTTVPDGMRNRLADGEERGAATRMATLTQREQQALEFIAQGYAKKQIAVAMGVSLKTVESHTTKLMKKLDIHDRVELTRFAIREGLVAV